LIIESLPKPSTHEDNTLRQIVSWKSAVPFEYEALRSKTQQTLVEFLNAELNLGSTFVRSATISSDEKHMEHFAQAKEKATKAAESVRRFVGQVADGKVRATICNQLAELDRLISTL
jgi:hypothetical protein